MNISLSTKNDEETMKQVVEIIRNLSTDTKLLSVTEAVRICIKHAYDSLCPECQALTKGKCTHGSDL